MTQDVPRSVKYCFLAITKEAFANVVRHSDADKVTVLSASIRGFTRCRLRTTEPMQAFQRKMDRTKAGSDLPI